MASFDPGVITVRTKVRPPDPVGRYIAGAVDFMAGLGLAGYRGHRLMARNVAFAGELGPQQFFQGAASLLPRGTTGVLGFNTALPNTHGPVVRANDVLDTIGRTQS